MKLNVLVSNNKPKNKIPQMEVFKTAKTIKFDTLMLSSKTIPKATIPSKVGTKNDLNIFQEFRFNILVLKYK